MEVFTTVSDLKSYLRDQRDQNKSIGLVPTMGALHNGHISLINWSTSQNDITVCSIFVNPTQFNNPEDLAKYPRTFESDCAMLQKAGCSAVFAPTVAEMYPEKPVITLNFGALETVMEGASRPGHFNGVGIVVGKLFNLVQPDKAYFGQKDLQQVAVIKRLVKDLAYPLELVVAATLREADGLAMSSRNTRLSSGERAIAPFIYARLSEAHARLVSGEDITEVQRAIQDQFKANTAFQLDYFEIVDSNSMQPIDRLRTQGNSALCIAAFLGPVRLIDNIVF